MGIRIKKKMKEKRNGSRIVAISKQDDDEVTRWRELVRILLKPICNVMLGIKIQIPTPQNRYLRICSILTRIKPENSCVMKYLLNL